jgi:hypothetical protein
MEISYYQKWKEQGFDYDDGVAFYNQYGQNNTLKKLFAAAKTPFTVEKLKAEIKNLDFIKVKISTTKPKIKRELLPVQLQKEFDKLHGLIQEISYHHARLDAMPNDNARFESSKVIVSAVNKRRAIYKRIDHWLLHGKDLVRHEDAKPQKIISEDKELQRYQLKAELIRLRTQRSKLKTNDKRIEDYNTICKRIDEINTILKNE